MEKISLWSWTGKLNIIKMTILPKSMYKFNAIPIKLLLTKVEKSTPKFILNFKGYQIVKSILRNKKTFGGFTLRNIKTYYKADKITMYGLLLAWGQANRPTEQNWEPKNKLSYQWPVDFQKGCQDHSMVKGQSFQ